MNPKRFKECGTALVEFALSFAIFSVAMFGVVEFSRAMFAWNTAAEATRLANRMARLCDNSDPQWTIIRNRVRYFVEVSGQISVGSGSDWLSINYSPKCYDYETGITGADPCWVETKLNNLQLTLTIPLMNVSIPLPEYRTKAIREGMSSTTLSGEKNPLCG